MKKYLIVFGLLLSILFSFNLHAETNFKDNETQKNNDVLSNDDKHIIEKHVTEISEYLEGNSKFGKDADILINDYYDKEKNLASLAEKNSDKVMNSLKDDVYSTIEVGDKTVQVLNNGSLIIDQLTAIDDSRQSRAVNKYKTVTNNWKQTNLYGGTLVSFKLKAQFGYNGRKAWVVQNTIRNSATPYYIMEILSRDVYQWSTKANSRTLQMYVIACQNYQGIRWAHFFADTRVGLTKYGTPYKSVKKG